MRVCVRVCTTPHDLLHGVSFFPPRGHLRHKPTSHYHLMNMQWNTISRIWGGFTSSQPSVSTVPLSMYVILSRTNACPRYRRFGKLDSVGKPSLYLVNLAFICFTSSGKTPSSRDTAFFALHNRGFHIMYCLNRLSRRVTPRYHRYPHKRYQTIPMTHAMHTSQVILLYRLHSTIHVPPSTWHTVSQWLPPMACCPHIRRIKTSPRGFAAATPVPPSVLHARTRGDYYAMADPLEFVQAK